MSLKDWIAGKTFWSRISRRRNAEESRASAMQSWAKTIREPELPAVAHLARRIVHASLKDAEVLKGFIHATDERDGNVRLFMTICEFLCFYMHLTNRIAFGELGHEQRCKVQAQLHPLVVPVIESLFPDWPPHLKDRMQNEFNQRLNDSELEYGNCKKVLNTDNSFADDALFSKFAGNVCELLCGEKIETKTLLETHLKVTQLAFHSFKELNLSETLRLISADIRNEASQEKKTDPDVLARQAGADYARLSSGSALMTFTEEEKEAVASYLNMIQGMADDELVSRAGAGARALFHPETQPIFQALGLRCYADKLRLTADFEKDENERHKVLTKIIAALAKAVWLSGFPIFIYDWACAVEATGDVVEAKRLFADFLEKNRQFNRTSMYEIYLHQRNLEEAVCQAEKRIR